MELPSLPSLAVSTFAAGPSDEVAAADIYKLKSSVGGGISTINSIQELNLDLSNSIFDFNLDAGIATDFLSKLEGGKLGFDKDLLTNRILGTSGEFKSTFSELNESLKKGALLSTYKDKADKLLVQVGSVKSMVNSANIKDVRSLGSFINKYTETKIFSGKDSGALSGLLSSVITTSSDLGIPGAFKAITDTVNDRGIIGRVTRAVLPIALKNSDSKLLREMSSSTAGALINVFAPGFTQNFSKAFVYRGDRSNTLNSFEDIFTAYRNVESQWDVVNREGSTALNILALTTGSRDFQNIVTSGVKYWSTEQKRGNTPPVHIDPLYGLSGVYRETTVGKAIARDFPKVALLSVYNKNLPKRNGLPAGMRTASNNNVIDPRLVNGALGALFGN